MSCSSFGQSYDAYVSHLVKPLVFRLTSHQALVYALLDQLFTSIFVIIYIHNIFHKKMTLIIVIRNDKNDNDGDDFTAWKACKYGVFSGPYFPVFGLKTGKHGPEKTSYLGIFYALSKDMLNILRTLNLCSMSRG